MTRKRSACRECTQTCQLVHGSKKDLEPRVTSFFKIIIGHDFNEALFLPPKFAKTVKDLVNQESKLEDSSGTCWTVTLSYYKDSLAFHKGWYEFSVDKNLKIGDLLVVNYMKAGHFLVQAFGRDGCLKLNAAREHPPIKRAQNCEDVAADGTLCQTTCYDAGKKKCLRTSAQIQPTKTNCSSICEGENSKQLCGDNEVYLMVDRDVEYDSSDYRTCLYDLSSFEMQKNICSASKNEKHIDGQEGSPDPAQTSVKFQAYGHFGDKKSIETLVLSMETTTNTDTIQNSKDSGPIGNTAFECDEVHLDGLSNDFSLATASVRVADNCIKGDDTSNVAIPPQSPARNSGNLPQSHQRRSRNLKLELSTREESGSSFAAPKMNKVARTDPVDSFDMLSTVATSFTCVAETNGRAYMNLPDHWPSVAFDKGGQGMAYVTLEDAEGREWKSTYHEKLGLRVLVAPWRKINAENGIQPGDHLVFSMTDASLNKYKFDIVRNQ